MDETPLSPISRIPPEVAHALGFYVYLYVDPRDRKVFYVGKGQGGKTDRSSAGMLVRWVATIVPPVRVCA